MLLQGLCLLMLCYRSPAKLGLLPSPPTGNAPLARYFLLGEGGSLLGVLYASGSTNVDVYATPAAATQTLDALRAAAQGWPPELSAVVLPAAEDAAAAVTEVLGRLSELEAATAFDTVHPVSQWLPLACSITSVAVQISGAVHTG